jgi:hypothetical protein
MAGATGLFDQRLEVLGAHVGTRCQPIALPHYVST